MGRLSHTPTGVSPLVLVVLDRPGLLPNGHTNRRCRIAWHDLGCFCGSCRFPKVWGDVNSVSPLVRAFCRGRVLCPTGTRTGVAGLRGTTWGVFVGHVSFPKFGAAWVGFRRSFVLSAVDRDFFPTGTRTGIAGSRGTTWSSLNAVRRFLNRRTFPVYSGVSLRHSRRPF